jgi:hypothetical protein
VARCNRSASDAPRLGGRFARDEYDDAISHYATSFEMPPRCRYSFSRAGNPSDDRAAPRGLEYRAGEPSASASASNGRGEIGALRSVR